MKINAPKLTDRLIKQLAPPQSGYTIAYDTEVSGLGVRITAAGSKSFVLRYRHNRIARTYTIGRYGTNNWTLAAARKRAGELRRKLARGDDPAAERSDARRAPTVADLCERFLEEHLPKTRPSTQRDYRALIANDILPAMKHLKVASVTFSDVDTLHRKMTKRAPHRANRAVAVMSKMFNLAIKWGWRTDNPARGIERNQEPPRHRYLSGEELERLTTALAEHPDQQAANVIRLLLLTGARRGEVQSATWDQFDLADGVWTKPGATTKQKTEHRIPLSAPARQLLAELHEVAGDNAVFVFPGRFDGHRVEIKYDWAALCEAARIDGARLHDLRHSYASMLASAGLSLPVIGALLGHSQPQTTQRYAHLLDDPLREATERVGAVIGGGKSAEVIPLRKG